MTVKRPPNKYPMFAMCTTRMDANEIGSWHVRKLMPGSPLLGKVNTPALCGAVVVRDLMIGLNFSAVGERACPECRALLQRVRRKL